MLGTSLRARVNHFVFTSKIRTQAMSERINQFDHQYARINLRRWIWGQTHRARPQLVKGKVEAAVGTSANTSVASTNLGSWFFDFLINRRLIDSANDRLFLLFCLRKERQHSFSV